MKKVNDLIKKNVNFLKFYFNFFILISILIFSSWPVLVIIVKNEK